MIAVAIAAVGVSMPAARSAGYFLTRGRGAELARGPRSGSRGPLPTAPVAFRASIVLVGFRSGTSPQRRAAIERAVGATAGRRLGPAIRPVGRGRANGQEFLAPFELRVPPARVLGVVRALRRLPAVAYAEPDYLMRASATPDDPFFPLQWGSSNVGQPVPGQEAEEMLGPPTTGAPGADDGALKAWQIATGSRSIVIGEADTGVDFNHPDLAANIWTNPGRIGGCAAGTHGYDVLSRTCDPMDEDATYGGHGTHVAGIMGAVGDDGIGVAGMNWQTSILPVKWIQNASGGETGALIEALQWLVAAKQAGVNIRVVNDSDTFAGAVSSQALSDEIDTLGANGILFVTAAGNAGANDDEPGQQRYPCSYDRPTEICVTASNNDDQLPGWANYGPRTVDLAAPGVSIYSTLREDRYGYLSGGSMATPQVAGAAALILSVAPWLSAASLKADILQNVDQLPSLSGKVISGGRLDVYRALSALPPAPAAGATPYGQSVSGEFASRQAEAVAVISGLAVSPVAFTPARPGVAGVRRAVSGGARISFIDSEPALSRFTVLALRSGVEGRGHRCAGSADRARAAAGKRCTRSAVVGSFVRHDRAGRNSFRFSGCIGARVLAPGRYALQAVPMFRGRIGVGRATGFRTVRTIR